MTSTPTRTDSTWTVYEPDESDPAAHVVNEALGQPFHLLDASCWCEPEDAADAHGGTVLLHRQTH